VRTRRPRLALNRPTGRINPFELFLLAVCAVQGWGILSHTAQPPSLLTLLPPTLRLLEGVLLLVGGVLSVSGLTWPNPFTGVEIKRIGLVAAGGATLAYGVAILIVSPAGGFLVAATNLAFALACAVRIWQVSQDLNQARGRIRSMRTPGGGDGDNR
jgi:hypothetical protein